MWLLKSPSAWPLALVPTVVCVVLVVVLGTVGVGLAEHLVGPQRHDGSTTGVLFAFLLRVVSWLAAVLVALVLALALAQPLSGPALDALVKRREADLGLPPRPDGGTLAGIYRSLRVTAFGLAVTLPLVAGLALVTLFVPIASVVTVPLKLLVTCTMLAWDVVDYPLSLRGAGVRARLAWFSAHGQAGVGMGVGLALMFLLPGAQLLLIGAGVAGATRLVAELEA